MSTTRTLPLIAATFVVLLSLQTGRAADADAQGRTKVLISVLDSDASLFQKARACQQLGEIGTAKAVPALARLLTDPQLSAYARSGLEGIPDPSAASALRNATQTLKGPLLAGVVNSLGALRDDKAVDLLARLAADPASGAAREALLALGNISTEASIRVLEQALASGPEAIRSEASAACLLAADRRRTAGDLSRALALYDLLRKPGVPTTFRVGATRGAILARRTDRVPFLLTQLRSDELPIRNAALLTIREIPGDALATALNAEVLSAAPELQAQLLPAIADCHNQESVAVVQKLASSPNSDIRKAALTVLPRLGPDAGPALLRALSHDRLAGERSLILAGLRAMPGSAVDQHVLQALASAGSPAIRVDLIRILESRGVVSAAPEILKQSSAPEASVRIAALSALSSLAGQSELRPLLAFTRSCPDAGVRDAAETALAGICTRLGAPACEIVLTELQHSTKPADRNSWVRVLAQVGYPKALPAIEAAATGPDSEVAENALTQLGHWPSPAPMATLLDAAESSPSHSFKKTARSSVLQLAATAIDGSQASDSQVVSWLTRVHGAADSIDEKRKILGLLGRLKTVESFHLLEPYLGNTELRTEAAVGVVQIAPVLAKTEVASALKTALEKIAETVTNDDLRRRAAQIAKSIPAPKPEASLFDGRSLSGWEGSTNVWRVRDGAIVGGSLSGNPQNEFLVTLRPYTNFILRLEYKLVGTEGFVNGGVQFRSVRVPNPANEMSGYQADIGAGYSGSLYDESRRNTFLVQAAKETVQRIEKSGDWNTYEVRCEGNRIQLFLNGEQTVDYTEGVANIPQQGLIGLQIHGDCKAEISFRNIRLQEL